MPRRGRGRSGSGPSDSKPPAFRRITRERRSSVKGGGGGSSGDSSSGCSSSSGGSKSRASGGSRSKASKGASQSVPPSVSPSSSSSLPVELGNDPGSDSGYGSCVNSEFECDYDSDGQRPAFQPDARGQLIASIVEKLGYFGQMLLLFETPSGFALFTFSGVHCYLPDSVNDIWAEFADLDRAFFVVYPKGFLSFGDKSSAVNADTGVDKQLVDLINKWHHPGMKLCVGKPEYKTIIESKLKIPCMRCQTVMEIMWGIQHQIRGLVPEEKSELTKVDRLPMSQGLKEFLSHYGFDDVKPEMVNEEIVMTACALFDCDVDDERRLRFLRDAGLHIRDISGIACKDWDVLKLAVAVKVICCPKEELTDFHEVLAEDVVSKLKADARKYIGIAVKVNWLSTYRKVASDHHIRIAKEKMLGSLVKKAKKAYEAEQADVCEKGKLEAESPSERLFKTM